MQGLYDAILESDPDGSFDDAYSTFEYFIACHDDLTFPCSFPDLEIFQIKEFSILIGMDKDEWFAFMQEHISYFIAFLEFDGFDASCSLSHRSEISALEEEHPSMFGQNADIIGIIHRFDAEDLLFISKLHDDGREFLE